MFSKASDEWQTPADLFAALHAEFDFLCDMAATKQNALLPRYWGPDHERIDRRNSLVFRWPARCWLNPPYSQVRAFVAKAAEEAKRGSLVVCLVPARTDTRWWHEHVWDRVSHKPRRGVQVRFLKGRLTFVGAAAGAPFPSVVVVFDGLVKK